MADIVERLAERSQKERAFVAHAEANRDDWFATMPPEISAEALERAELDEAAASEIKALRATNARLSEALRSVIVVVPGDDEIGRTFCSACGTWQNDGEPEKHADDCWLIEALTTPSTGKG